MGSVKDLEIIERPSEASPGRGRFVFSDRYSVFDWGEMPDPIEAKGYALCILSAFFFELMERKGVKTHYRGVIEDGVCKRLDELDGPSNVMEVTLFRVIPPVETEDGYDYSPCREVSGNFLIPLEVIYRNMLPEGSSVFKRLREGKISPEDLGLDEMPRPDAVLPVPVIDISTKLESTDRYVSWEEARRMCGLSDEEISLLRETTLEVDHSITARVEEAGLVNQDGKVEYAFDVDRNLVLVDAVGTPDECRFTLDGIPVSKEIARIYYRGSRWHEVLEQAKKEHGSSWKDHVEVEPEPLPPALAECISGIYKACANEITGRRWFDGVPPLRELVREAGKFV